MIAFPRRTRFSFCKVEILEVNYSSVLPPTYGVNYAPNVDLHVRAAVHVFVDAPGLRRAPPLLPRASCLLG